MLKLKRLPAWGYWSLYGIESGSTIYAMTNDHGAWWYHPRRSKWLPFDWDRLVGPAFVIPEEVTSLEVLVMTGYSIKQLERIGTHD